MIQNTFGNGTGYRFRVAFFSVQDNKEHGTAMIFYLDRHISIHTGCDKMNIGISKKVHCQIYVNRKTNFFFLYSFPTLYKVVPLCPPRVTLTASNRYTPLHHKPSLTYRNDTVWNAVAILVFNSSTFWSIDGLNTKPPQKKRSRVD